MPSKLFFLNTKNAINNQNIRWNINDPIILYPRPNLKVAVKSVHFENNVYPINSINNILYFVENNISKSVTIPPNNYTAYTLGTEMITRMNAVSAQLYTFSYDFVKFIYTITGVGGLSFKIVSGTNSINTAIGYTIGASSTTSLSSNIPIDIAGPKYIYIIANLSYQNFSDNTKNVLKVIPLTEQFGNTIYYEDSNPFYHSIGSSTYTNINIEIRDENDELFIQQGTASFFIELIFQWDE